MAQEPPLEVPGLEVGSLHIRSHPMTSATKARQRPTTTREDGDKERWDMVGQMVLPPPSPEVRIRWLDFVITHLADPSRSLSSPPFGLSP